MKINENEMVFLADQMKEGLIYIDSEGIIKLYNTKAKEIFGLGTRWVKGHKSGRIEAGDFVIIADNCLGKDDGGLLPTDLECLGIESADIKPGSVVIAAGEYLANDGKAVYRSWESTADAGMFELETQYQGIDISASIDQKNKTIQISVKDSVYSMEYYNAIGHMVVLEKESGEVKFFQAFGYTARAEAIKNILGGGNYLEKGKSTEFQVIGKSIFDIHDRGDTIGEFYSASKGGLIGYKNRVTEINGFPVRCSLIPFAREGKTDGAVLLVEDLSTLRKALEERDLALSYVEEINHVLEANMESYEDFNEFLGESEDARRVKRLAFKASKTSSTVLLLGESGTGKTILASCIHNASSRSKKPFIHVNCAAMPEPLLESELFGYDKGAFTGAVTGGKEGLFSKADGGTIFLDEFAEISPSSQVKLLKVLQNKTFYKIGGTEEIKVDVRIIAATNKNIEQELRTGSLREDLYYRINVFPITIGPLRERKDDITYLANKLTQQICKKLEVPTKLLSAGFQACLLEYSWPGNVRELENVLERAINLAEEPLLDIQHLPNIKGLSDASETQTTQRSLKETLAASERKAIIEALERTGNDKQKAQRVLKVGKTKFYQMLKEHKIQ